MRYFMLGLLLAGGVVVATATVGGPESAVAESEADSRSPAPQESETPVSEQRRDGSSRADSEVDAGQIAEILELRRGRGGILAGSIFEEPYSAATGDSAKFEQSLVEVARESASIGLPVVPAAPPPLADSDERLPQLGSWARVANLPQGDLDASKQASGRGAPSAEQRLVELIRRTGRALDRRANRYEIAGRHQQAARVRALAAELRAEIAIISESRFEMLP